MKRTTALFLALILALSLLTGCGSSAGTGGGETSSATVEIGVEEDKIVSAAKTMGEVINLEGAEFRGRSFTDEDFVYLFELNGISYRAAAKLTPQLSEKLFELDINDSSYDDSVAELISSVEINQLDNLTRAIPPQKELDKLVGKTGQELLDDGWSCYGHNLDTMEFYMHHGLFSYLVVFDGDVDAKEEDEDKMIKALTVKSIAYDDLGEADNLEYTVD